MISTLTASLNNQFKIPGVKVQYTHIVLYVKTLKLFQMDPKSSLNCNWRTSSIRVTAEPVSVQYMGNLITQLKENYTILAQARSRKITNMDAEKLYRFNVSNRNIYK
jgi:hypothetical protein